MKDLDSLSEMTISELIDYIVDEFHTPLRTDLETLENKSKDICEIKWIKEKLTLQKEIFKQFKYEIINHIDREKKEFFPEIIKLEKGLKVDILFLKKFLNIQEIEHNEINNYLIWWKNTIKNLNIKDSKEYEELKLLVNKLYDDIKNSIYISLFQKNFYFYRALLLFLQKFFYLYQF